MMKKLIAYIPFCILQALFLVFFIASTAQATTPTGSWFKGCYSDTDSLTNYENVDISGNIDGLSTAFTDENAIACAVKCSTRKTPKKYAIFSQTGVCLCAAQAYNISATVSNSLCLSKSCDFNQTITDCDEETSYHWLVDTSTLLTAINIVTSGILHGSVPQNITVTTISAIAGNISFQYNFGDGITADYVKSRVFSYVWTKTGYYKVTVTAKNAAAPSVAITDSKVFQVLTPPRGVNVKTPIVFETELDYFYTAAVMEGGNMSVGAKVYIGEAEKETVAPIQVEDAFIVPVGANLAYLMKASMVYSNPNQGIYIMSNYKFPTKGFISAFEVFFVKVGFIRFQIYRPSCSSGKYCFALGGCYSAGACPKPEVDMMSTATVNASLYSVATPNFKMMSEISFIGNTTGLVYLKVLSPSLEVQRGDVLGLMLDPSGGDISHTAMPNITSYYVNSTDSVYPGTEFNSGLQSKHIQHLIMAHLSTTSTIKMKTKFKEHGLARIHVTATNDILPNYFTNTYVHVQERIVNLKITKPSWYNERAYPVNEKISMETSKEKGSNITYEWIIELGAKNYTYNNTDGKLDFTPSAVGIYTVFVKAFNLINSENATLQFAVQQRIVDVIVLNQINNKILSEASLPVNITVRVVNGTNVTLEGTVKSNKQSELLLSADPPYQHKFTFPPGTCEKTSITVKANNLIPGSAKEKTVSVEIICPIKKLKVSSQPAFSEINGIKRVLTASNADIVLTVTVEEGSFVVYRLNDVAKTNPEQMTNHSDQVTPKELTFSFKYKKQGIYKAVVSAENSLSKENFTFEIQVIDCQPEELELTGSPEKENPTFTTRGIDYKVTGNIKAPDCNTSKVPVKYKVELIALDKGDKIIDKRNLTKNAITNEIVYVLEKLTRPPGRYVIRVKQSYKSGNETQTISKDAFVTIKQTPLFAVIASGTTRSIPLKKRLTPDANTTEPYNFTLDASASNDPDNKTMPLKYEWFCKADSWSHIEQDNRTKRCLNTDFKTFQPLTTKELLVNTKGLYINLTYHFLLSVTVLSNKNDSRRSNYTQKVTFLDGEPPEVAFQCVTNCDTKWNMQEKLILKGQCPGCINLQEIRYLWAMRFKNGSNIPGVTNSQEDRVTPTMWNKQNLVINAGILQESTIYQVSITAWYKGSSKKTVITMERETGKLPYGGSCIATPTKGTVAETKYQIQCKNWKCPDFPIKYEFMTKLKAKSTVSVSSVSRIDYPIWYAGNEPRNPANILPLGDPDKEYNLTMVIRIYNSFNSFRQLPEMYIKVENVKTSASENASAAITAAIENSKPKTNDSSSLSQWASSAASMLNDETTTKTVEGTTEAPKTEKEVEQIENTRATIIESMSSANLEKSSIADIKQFGEALSAVTAKTTQLNDQAQDAGSKLLEKMADSFLKNDQANAGAESLEQASISIMGPLSNLMAATTDQSDVYLDQQKTIEQNEKDKSSAPTEATPTKSTTGKAAPTRAQIKQTAKKTKSKVESYLKVLDSVSEKLFRNKVAGESASVTKTPTFNLALIKKTMVHLGGSAFDTGDQSYGVQLPGYDEMTTGVSLNGTTISNETEVSCQSSSMKKILQTWDLDNAQNSGSEIESLTLLSNDYKQFNVSNLTSAITITIKNRPEKLNISKLSLGFPGEMKIKKENLKSIDQPLLVEFGSPDMDDTNLTVLIQYGSPATMTNYDAKLIITAAGIDLSKNNASAIALNSNCTTSNGTASSNCTTAANATATADPDKPLVRNSHIKVIDSKTIIMWDFINFTYGYRGNNDVYFNFYYKGALPKPVLVDNDYTFDVLELRRKRNYTMRTFSGSCLYFSKTQDKWTHDGCKVDPHSSTFNITTCKCNHLTSFGGFFVKPNPIPPLTADMFLTGYVVFVAVTTVLLFFVIGLVFARRADKKDLLKVGVCPLPDNNPDHHYIYEISLWTGGRRNAGTKSNVYFILSGDLGDTRIRHLKDPERPTFQQNSSDVFIFSTETPLGDLSHLRIWHDNSGGGWYLRKVVVTDIQTDKTFVFLCNRWLAVDHDDGQVEMLAPVSGNEDLKDFNYVFMAKTRSDLTDGHLWFSLYGRPPRSSFTRCQRLACCMSLLMTSMLASAMFYRSFPKPTPETANYAAGLTFTWQQVYVAIISAAITVPINIIIVTLFRSSKPNDIINVPPKRAGSKASLADNESLKSADSMATLNSPESPVFNKNGQEPLLHKKKTAEALNVQVEQPKKTKQQQERDAKKKKKESYLFPHWCIYVGWAFTFIAIVSSAVVVIMYGIAFGNSTSWEWLTAIIIGFIQDIIVIQPIKIFLIAIFFAIVIKRIQDERPQVEEQGRKLAEDEEWLHTHADTSFGTSVDTTTLRPPDDVKLGAMRELRFKERKMYAIVREILLYTFFVLVTFSISYSLREERGFWQTYGLEQLFKLRTEDNNEFETNRFSAVLSYNDFWKWADDVLVDGLFPTPWYNTDTSWPKKTRDFPGKLFINDLNHKIVNGVRLRQVRVNPDSCKLNDDVKDVMKIDCAAPYGFTSEMSTNFGSNWTDKIGKRPTLTRENQQWLYQTWKELDGYPFMAELTTYFGGGYTQELFPKWPNKENLKKLKDKRWLDRHTRAAIIEFALFNPATNHFSMVTITFEFAATGGCVKYYSIYTFKLYRYTTGYAFFTIVCEVIFMLLLLLYMYRECKEWYQLGKKYFVQFWNLIEVIINVLSLVAIGFYFYRQKLADDLLKRLPAKKPETFINFQFAAYIDQIFIYVVSLIVFFVSIKFVKLLRFNRRMSILAETLKDAWYPLGMFSIVMGIVLFSTFTFATIVFGRQMYGYRNLLVTAATQISLLLGKFSFYEYQNTNRVIGPIFFFSYIIMVNWILLNMFLSIINDSYEVVSNNLTARDNDYEIVDFVMDQFKAWVGFGKTRKDEIQQNIRWQSAKRKVEAIRAFSATSRSSNKKGVRWNDEEDILGGLKSSSYWQDAPIVVKDTDLETTEVNKTVDRFIECINLLYFDDAEIAEKMSKKVKQEINDVDFLEQEKSGKQ